MVLLDGLIVIYVVMEFFRIKFFKMVYVICLFFLRLGFVVVIVVIYVLGELFFEIVNLYRFFWKWGGLLFILLI